MHYSIHNTNKYINWYRFRFSMPSMNIKNTYTLNLLLSFIDSYNFFPKSQDVMSLLWDSLLLVKLYREWTFLVWGSIRPCGGPPRVKPPHSHCKVFMSFQLGITVSIAGLWRQRACLHSLVSRTPTSSSRSSASCQTLDSVLKL